MYGYILESLHQKYQADLVILSQILSFKISDANSMTSRWSLFWREKDSLALSFAMNRCPFAILICFYL